MSLPPNPHTGAQLKSAIEKELESRQNAELRRLAKVFVDELTKELPEKEKMKALTSTFMSMKEIGGSAAVVLKVFQSLKVLAPIIEPFQQFLNIFIMGIQEGLAESAQDLAEALFTKDNIELMRELGLLVADLMSLGLKPLAKEIRDLTRDLRPFLNLIKDIRRALKEIDNPILSGGIANFRRLRRLF